MKVIKKKFLAGFLAFLCSIPAALASPPDPIKLQPGTYKLEVERRWNSAENYCHVGLIQEDVKIGLAGFTARSDDVLPLGRTHISNEYDVIRYIAGDELNKLQGIYKAGLILDYLQRDLGSEEYNKIQFSLTTMCLNLFEETDKEVPYDLTEIMVAFEELYPPDLNVGDLEGFELGIF